MNNMKEVIKEKLDKKLDEILKKDDITIEEYRILNEKLKDIEFDEKSEEREKLMSMMTKAF